MTDHIKAFLIESYKSVGKIGRLVESLSYAKA